MSTSYELVIECLPEMVALVNSEGGVRAANSLLCSFAGLGASDFFERGLGTWFPQAALATFCRLAVGMKTKEHVTFEENLLRWDGQLRRLEVKAKSCGEQVFLLVFKDVTDQSRTEYELIRYRQVVELCRDIVCITDAGGGILYANAACMTCLGYDPEQMVGTALFDYIQLRDLGLGWQIVQEAATLDKSLEEELRVLTKGGDVRHLNIIASGFKGSDQKANVCIIGRDATEQHHLERALIESQKMEGMGRLARGIAHDFNNLLQLILGSVQCLDNETDLPEEVRDWHDTIRTAAERGRTLVEQLQAFSKRDVGVRMPHALGTLLLGFTDLVRPMLSGGVTFSVNLHDPERVVEVDPGQIHQVLINFVINAHEAIGDEGAINISSADFERGGDRYIGIEVSDNGRGISEQNLSRIFEPFFSTKEHRRGTGLGLSVAFGIVDSHGGRIEVSSTEGRGSLFRVLLPRAPDGTRAVSMDQPSKVFGNDELILVVDDEPMQRMILRKQLEFLGYGVLDAEDGEHAVDLYEDYGEEIGCVLLDVVMPKLNGFETLEALKKLDDNIDVIVTTGLGRDDRVSAMLNAGAQAFLAKPFHIERLSAVLRAVLDGKGDAASVDDSSEVAALKLPADD